MRKLICVLLATVILLCVLPSCVHEDTRKTFTYDNEIITYEKADPTKTQLVVSRTGNIPAEKFCKVFEDNNPDIQIIYIDITGGDSNYAPLAEWVAHGDTPDVMIAAGSFFTDELIAKHFTDLSEEPILKKYQSEALQRTATNAHVYLLPGPSDVNAMMYNKTLFDEYGWEVPSTFDEFVALCDRIDRDTDGEIQAWNPNAKYTNEFTTVVEAFIYEETLAGIDNRTWYNDYTNGEATLAEHMAPFVEVVQTLIDHNILREEHFTYSATTRGKEFAAGKIAMINGNAFDGDNENYDFELIPFPTTSGTKGYICDSYSCVVGVPIKEHTEKEDEAITRFLEFFSSAEGQAAYIDGDMKTSNLKNASTNQSSGLAGLQPTIDAGHMFGLLDFYNKNLGSGADLHGIAKAMVTEQANGMELLRAVDAKADAAKNNENPDSKSQAEPIVIVTAEKDFTILETSFLIADAYREIADADIGLITHNEAYRGNMMRIYAGDISENMVTIFKPRSFANGSALKKVSMTGQQILDALNNPVGNEKTADCIYAFSGLKCEVAPWNPLGTKYLSVKLSDGSKLEADKRYTVAIWDGTVAEEFITETLTTYDSTWEAHMASYLKKQSKITPADDGRIALIWE